MLDCVTGASTMAGKYVRRVTAIMENINKDNIIIYFIISEKTMLADIPYAI